MAEYLRNLFIVNKAGGLIYHKAFPNSPNLNSNDYLRLASTFHSLHAIAGQVSPIGGSDGIESLEVETFCLHCFQSLTGVKFFVSAVPGTPDLHGFLRMVYTLYSDYVLKNPFYELDQVIRCELFDVHLNRVSNSKYGAKRR